MNPVFISRVLVKMRSSEQPLSVYMRTMTGDGLCQYWLNGYALKDGQLCADYRYDYWFEGVTG